MIAKTIVLWVLLVSVAQADILSGSIWRVIDGDTLIVSNVRVRLVGIDSPEIKQAFGLEAKGHLDQFVGDRVIVEYYTKDRWNRIIGKVYLDNYELDLGLMQVISGLAWYVPKYATALQGFLSWNDYESAQRQAQIQKRGLWRAEGPYVPPWVYRKK